MYCVDLGESFPIPTHILLQKLASIQPRTSRFKFARSPRTLLLSQVPECVDFERYGPNLHHAITRRYVFMVVVLTIALWSLGNSVCLDAIGRIMNVEKDEDNREVLNAVVSEVTVLGFIALLSGIASRSNLS